MKRKAHVLGRDLEPARRSPLVRQRRRGDTLSAQIQREKSKDEEIMEGREKEG